MKPYFETDDVQLYLGDMRDIVPFLGVTVDLVLADPPYQSTALAWDRWPDGWPAIAAQAADSLWCFGSMRMFLARASEFADWTMSQDIVWEKHNGSGFATDRFKRVHEHSVHWYRGPWAGVHHDVPRVARTGPAKAVRNRTAVPHTGKISGGSYVDDGQRLQRSVIQASSVHGRAIHPTEKPTAILAPLIEYGCPPGGVVLDPFAGSGSTAVAARLLGRRAVLVEADERYCEAIVARLAQGDLFAAVTG